MIRIPVITLAAVAASTWLMPAHAAGFDCSKFSHNDDGSWRVLAPLQIRGPRGRIDYLPDETYKEGNEKMGLDMAKLLNANCAKK